jgi:hypothetical protein
MFSALRIVVPHTVLECNLNVAKLKCGILLLTACYSYFSFDPASGDQLLLTAWQRYSFWDCANVVCLACARVPKISVVALERRRRRRRRASRAAVGARRQHAQHVTHTNTHSVHNSVQSQCLRPGTSLTCACAPLCRLNHNFACNNCIMR